MRTMHYHNNYRQQINHHLGRQPSKKQRKKPGESRGKTLKRLRKLSSVDLSDVINFMRGYTQNLSTKRKLMIAGMALALVTTLGVTWYLSKQNQPNGSDNNHVVDNHKPQISNLNYTSRINPGVTQNINFTAIDRNANNVTVPENIAKSVVEITNPQGHSVNQTARRLEDVGKQLFSTQFNDTGKEGPYNIRAIVEDKAGNAAVEHGNFDVSDKPVINSLSLEKIPSEGLAKVLVNASDTSGVAKAEIEFDGKRENMTKLPNGLFGYNITMPENPEEVAVNVHVTDPFNQSTTTSAEIDWSSKEAFINFVANRGYSTELAGKFYDNSGLTRQLFDEDRTVLENVLKIASNNATDLPKNLAYQILEQIEKDNRVKNKTLVAKSAFDILDKLGISGLNQKVSIYIPGNYSSALVQEGLPRHDLDAIRLLFDVSESQVGNDVFDFDPVLIEGKDNLGNEEIVDLWKDENRIPILVYTLAEDLEQTPSLREHLTNSESPNGRFVNALHRQRNFVLYRVLDFDPANGTVRLIYAKPDWDYYLSYLPNKKIVVNGTEITFPLLPLLNGAAMREQFPSRTDEMVIYASQYPVQLAHFNAKTGEVNPRPNIYQPQTLKDNLDLVWEGGKWGEFDGVLIDRIIKAYTDKDWKSFDTPTGWSDNRWARKHWTDFELRDFAIAYPDFNATITEFLETYNPKLANDRTMDLGLGFTDGLTLLDGWKVGNELHQYSRFRYLLYAKALGFAGMEVWAKDPSHPYVHETVAAPVPKYLLDQLPTDGKYFPGKMISRYVHDYDSSGNPLKLTVYLPTGEVIEF